MPFSRRTFFKLSVATLASLTLARGFRLASALSLNMPHTRLVPFAPLPFADLYLLPAYLAAQLIQADALMPLYGPPRAYDLDGITTPYTTRYTGDDPRLIIGYALARHGYSPNTPNVGHLTLIEKDLTPKGKSVPTATWHRQADANAPLLALEYAWCLPRASSNPSLARELIHTVAFPQLAAIPITPLPPRLHAYYGQWWHNLTKVI
jgi:hypothetical protein